MSGTKKKTGLGKGLKALIGEQQASSSSAAPFSIIPKGHAQSPLKAPIDSVETSPQQARKDFNAESLATLTDSIKTYGLLQPLIVRRHATDPAKYELIAGERRLRAAKNAGLESVPITLLEADNRNSAVMGLLENLQREDLNPIEESDSYIALAGKYDLTQEEISKAVGRSRPYIANVMRFAKLPGKVREMIRNGRISSGHAKVLLALEGSPDLMAAAELTAKKQLSVRQTEDLVKKLIKAAGAARSGQKKPDAYSEVREMLTRRFGTKVEILGRGQKGSITIHYFSSEDLIRIVELLKG